jgi:hypothetical protein
VKHVVFALKKCHKKSLNLRSCVICLRRVY